MEDDLKKNEKIEDDLKKQKKNKEDDLNIFFFKWKTTSKKNGKRTNQPKST